MARDDPAFAEALDWALRIADPDFAAWESHIAWLEADPAHATAFDAASLLIEDGVRGLAPARPIAECDPANDNFAAPSVPRRRWPAFAGGAALAAALAATLVLTLPGGRPVQLFRTAPGQQRRFTLGDGTQVVLNGDSALRLDPAHPRSLALDRGEAFLTVVHDPAHPFSVRAGDARFEDVGTAFDIALNGDHTDLAVLEGAVLYDPAGARVRIAGGQAIRIAGRTAVVRPTGGSIGGWRDGRLRYEDAPLGDVAGDLARAIGRPVIVDETVADKRFSGVIIVDADRARMFRRIGAVAGVAITRDGAGWRMMPPRR